MAASASKVGKLLKFSGKLPALRPLFCPHTGLLIRQINLWCKPNDPPVLPRKYEVSKDSAEWEYVTRLIPPPTVPAVTPKDDYPSGFVPANENGLRHPYFVQRTKNHLLPVYLKHEDRGQRKITYIRRVTGDIWALHEDVKKYVEEQEGRKIASQVLECNSVVKLKGDRYHWVEQWLLSKGF